MKTALVALALLVACDRFGVEVVVDADRADRACVLPTSRNTTYTPDMPVESADLNDFQDNIISRKWSSTPDFLPGAAFQVIAGAPTLDLNGLWTFQTNTTDVLLARIPLIPGTRITSLIVSFNMNDTNLTGELDFKLMTRPLGGAATAAISSTVSSPLSGWMTHDMIVDAPGGLPVTLGSNPYWLQIEATAGPFSGTPFFDGAKIVNDRL